MKKIKSKKKKKNAPPPIKVETKNKLKQKQKKVKNDKYTKHTLNLARYRFYLKSQVRCWTTLVRRF